MQAGREVRIFVANNAKNENGEIIADSDLYPLAQKVAQEIEDEVTYAGQIKVTVIRESRENVVAS
jgi:HD superfamily phosphodiesterase